MMTGRGRPRKQVDEQKRQHLAKLREQGRAELASDIEARTRDLSGVEKLAWLNGAGQDDEVLDHTVQRAKDEGSPWIEVAVALGETGDALSINRVKNRFRSRSLDNE